MGAHNKTTRKQRTGALEAVRPIEILHNQSEVRDWRSLGALTSKVAYASHILSR
jgi:hypothetical protein